MKVCTFDSDYLIIWRNYEIAFSVQYLLALIGFASIDVHAVNSALKTINVFLEGIFEQTLRMRDDVVMNVEPILIAHLTVEGATARGRALECRARRSHKGRRRST